MDNFIKNEKMIEDGKWIDTHCHYEHSIFNENRKNIIENMENFCEKLICSGTDISSNEKVYLLSKKYPFLFNMVGFCPTCSPFRKRLK